MITNKACEYMEKQAAGMVPPGVRGAYRFSGKFGLDPLSVGMGGLQMSQGVENIQGFLGGQAGATAAAMGTTKAFDALGKTKLLTSLASKAPGGKLGLALKAAAGLGKFVTGMGTNFLGYSVGAGMTRPLGKAVKPMYAPHAPASAQVPHTYTAPHPGSSMVYKPK